MDKQCSSCGGFCGDVCEREDVEPIAWNDGYPTKPYAKEWFIAETVFGDRVVLKSLAEENAYDFTTADRTYIKKETVRRWMQFPDSQYVPFSPAKPNPNDVVKPIGEIRTRQIDDSPVQVITHFYTEPPPVGTKLYAQPLLNQTCCGCGRSGGYALYCGWCWNKADKESK